MALEQVPIEEWPRSENRPLLLLPFDPEELSRRFGLVFSDDVDDLGEIKLAVIRMAFGIAVLGRYKDDPDEGTVVYVDRNADLDSTCEAVVSGFGLSRSDISWITTALGEPT